MINSVAIFTDMLLCLSFLQISMAYEARAHYPDQNIHITNEIIHNPQVTS